MNAMRVRLGFLYPGQMGGSLASLASQEGAEIYTCVTGRSERTQKLAKDCGCTLLETEEELLAQTDLILSVLRPDKALEVAKRIADKAANMSAGIDAPRCRHYVDLNAISPRSVATLETYFESVDIKVIDGGILGGPARLQPRYCPLLPLSGPDAADVVALLQPVFGSDRVKLVGDQVGQASALKMAYASLNKGFQAILTNTLTFAARSGCYDQMIEELGRSRPDVLETAKRLPPDLSKSFRWIGEMREIGAAFSDAGLDGGQSMFEGAAETWEAVEKTPFGKESIEEALAKKRSLSDTVKVLDETMGDTSRVAR